MTLLVIFGVLAAISSTACSDPGIKFNPLMKALARDEWQCGSGWFTKWFSKYKTEKDCPEQLDAANQCCIAHDTCYDNQEGKSYCDAEFCGCLAYAFQPSPICSNREGPYFCYIVAYFGQSAYDAAAHHGRR